MNGATAPPRPGALDMKVVAGRSTLPKLTVTWPFTLPGIRRTPNTALSGRAIDGYTVRPRRERVMWRPGVMARLLSALKLRR